MRKEVTIYYNLEDKLSFGKYKDKTIQYVLDIDVNYINWLLRNNIEGFNLESEAKKYYENTKHNQELNKTVNYLKNTKSDYTIRELDMGGSWSGTDEFGNS